MSDSFETSWTVGRQAPLWMGFSRQEYWNGLPFPFPGDLPDPGIEPMSPTWQAAFLPLNHLGSPMNIFRQILIFFVCADLLSGVVIITVFVSSLFCLFSGLFYDVVNAWQTSFFIVTWLKSFCSQFSGYYKWYVMYIFVHGMYLSNSISEYLLRTDARNRMSGFKWKNINFSGSWFVSFFSEIVACPPAMASILFTQSWMALYIFI